MYIVKYRKGNKSRTMELPFKNLQKANQFIKTCIVKGDLILRLEYTEDKEI